MIAPRSVFRFTAFLYLLLGLLSLAGVIYALATQQTTIIAGLAAGAVLIGPCLVFFALFIRSADKVRASLRWLGILLGAHLGLTALFSWRLAVLLAVPLAFAIFGAFCHDQRGSSADPAR